MFQSLIRRLLPHSLRAPLWGDRERWGLSVQPDDPCWREWQKTYTNFYSANQRKGIGTTVNDAGYGVMSSIDLTGKTVLEIGPGDIRHDRFWHGNPAEYILADIQPEMLEKGANRLRSIGVRCRTLALERGDRLPLDDASVDAVVSFYSLEHLYPLRPYLDEIERVLRSGGILIGAIPAEGGLAWGGGRFLTSRRWLKNNTRIDPDKIICWEHPNFAETIMSELERMFDRQKVRWWPFSWLPLLDVNLIIRYVYRKRG